MLIEVLILCLCAYFLRVIGSHSEIEAINKTALFDHETTIHNHTIYASALVRLIFSLLYTVSEGQHASGAYGEGSPVLCACQA
jgi:hypothetical protein